MLALLDAEDNAGAAPKSKKKKKKKKKRGESPVPTPVAAPETTSRKRETFTNRSRNHAGVTAQKVPKRAGPEAGSSCTTCAA